MNTEAQEPIALDWMLLDHQVSDTKLAASLAQEYFHRLHRLARLLVTDWALTPQKAGALLGLGDTRVQAWRPKTFRTLPSAWMTKR